MFCRLSILIRLLGLALLLSASACGWHLRGQLAPPPDIEDLRIVSEARHTELLRQLETQLNQQGIALADATASAPYTLVLEDENTRKRTVGVGADALAAAYELTLSVDYQLLDTAGTMIGQPLRASVSRSYDYINNDPGAAAQEERLLAEEMRQELVQQILRRTYVLIGKNQEAHGQAAP